MIDLHVHSRASDGTTSPADLVAAAAALGLSAVALTDHDTLSGLPEFLTAAAAASLTGIPGVEVSCSWYAGTMHILGLFVDRRASALERLLARIRQSRTERNQMILERLCALGVPITAEELALQVPGEVVGRPHIAHALVQRGYCDAPQEAFDRFIGGGKPAYVRRYLPLPEEAIAVIHLAGGVAVWAHPLAQLRESPAKLRQTARYLKDKGLDGLEVRYVEYTAAETKTAEACAGQLQLLMAGGSDFHGANTPDVRLGWGRGSLHVPAAYLEPLLHRAKRHREQAALALADPAPV